MKRYSFNTAYTQAREMYGLELNPDEFENIGITAWGLIGNKEVRLYKYKTIPLVDDSGAYYVDLPCNCDYVEAITKDYEDYQKTTNQNISGNNQNGWIEGYIETRKFNTNHSYLPGGFIKYTQVGNRVYLSDKFDAIHILYKGVLVDEEGLPYLSESEADAVAAFCVYVDDYKRARVTRDQVQMQFAQISEQKWKQKCTQARVPEYINQNEMDEILNVLVSWDRKRFGKSFKPMR